ncbi:hypothetical protein BpHYR1_026400 [Brachionus plicatilis]|uniref:Uncharacterized protein n=1 Tax=Brachionus plicatilis TaxID=10195 RepID=A0A3M7R5P4_BRAPC|nr:hypothetical protein BpHYR1_026400 [Brachionus plicatilis]
MNDEFQPNMFLKIFLINNNWKKENEHIAIYHFLNLNFIEFNEKIKFKLKFHRFTKLIEKK